MEKIIEKKDFIARGGKFVFSAGKKQVLLLQVGSQIFALDNRCPHEGYPLSEGTLNVEDCALTCNWHNWKFNLKTGECFVGQDHVKTYPVTTDEDKIFVDLRGPSLEETTAAIMSGLKTAFEKRQYGRLCREVTRLFYHGIDPLIALKNAIFWSYDKFEYGITHAYAAAADWISLYQELEVQEDKIICITEAIDHLAWDALRHQSYPFVSQQEEYTFEKLFHAIIHEEVARAEGLVLNALEKGLRYQDLEEVFSKAALEHYNDFGHSLIYVVKVGELCNVFNDALVDRALVLSLVRSLCYSTKEDLIPEFKEYRPTLHAIEQKEFGKDDVDNLEESCSIKKAYQWVDENIEKGSPEALYQKLLCANAKNFLRYDMTYQEATGNSVNKNVGWLDFTHGITFANAVRRICTLYPAFWRQGLLQMASFYGRNNTYTTEVSLAKWKISQENFKTLAVKVSLDHGMPLPIFSAHILKTAVATLEEAAFLGEGVTSENLLAANFRFLSSSIKQKHVRRTAHQSIQLVARDFE